jgi:hypothetical protein
VSPDVAVTRGPDPDPEELAAIVAAVRLVLASGTGSEPEDATAPPRWRFSGRWWSRPIATRRERPFAF